MKADSQQDTPRLVKVAAVAAITVAVLFFLWGAYWLAKHGSYALWYEDMVKETIKEMVKPEALN